MKYLLTIIQDGKTWEEEYESDLSAEEIVSRHSHVHAAVPITEDKKEETKIETKEDASNNTSTNKSRSRVSK